MERMREPASLRTFYHLLDTPLQDVACNGLACFAARQDAPERWAKACRQTPTVYCLGKCYASPSDSGHDVLPHVSCHARKSVLLQNVADSGVTDLLEYIKRGGGDARQCALRTSPDDLVKMICASQLRGRGGAGFPAWRKWQTVAMHAAPRKYLVINADEGDPGAFSDRFLMERDPFLLIEGAIVTAQAIGANAGFVYVRKEYPDAARVMSEAIVAARAAGWLGERFDLECVVGAGSYLCGEETALLNALEGRRPEARLRPPQVAERGLFGYPTLVHNVETLCCVPWIAKHGAEAFAELGFSASRGTKLLSLNSLFNRPGLYEVEFGIGLDALVGKLGLGLRRGPLKGLMVGGPLAGIVPPALLHTRLGYEEMAAIGCAVGHGGVIAFANDSSIAAIAAEVFRFGARESCGKCTPCRLGIPALAYDFATAAAPPSPKQANGIAHDAVIDALATTSLCGHGRGIAEFARALQRHFPEEWSACRG